MLNIAGSEYDLGNVVFTVVQECEHRRRGLGSDGDLMAVAHDKLAQIKKAYDEFGGSAAYWQDVKREVMETAMPQYVAAAAEMDELERNAFNVWRGGDVASRFAFALIGLLIGSVIIAIPFIPIFEEIFAFALTFAGFVYPDLVRYTYERRHARMLNRLVDEAVAYQSNTRLHYMTTTDIRQSFTIGNPDDSNVIDVKRIEQ